MRKGSSLRKLPLMVALGTIAAIAGGMFVAAPGGAATPEQTEYSAKFEAECVLGPGVINNLGKIVVETKALGPSVLHPGEQITFTGASSTVTTPAEWGSSLAIFGSTEARGAVTNFVLNSTNLSPAEVNIAKPSEYPNGLPYHTPVESGKAITFRVPETGTFSFGPYTVTGTAGQYAELTVNTEPGFEKTSSGGYAATGKGIVSTTTGYKSNGEKTVGPVTVACTAPKGVVLGKTPIQAVSTTTSSSSSSTTTTTSSSSTTTSSTTTTTSSSSTTTSSTTTTTSSTSTALHVKFENWKLSGSLTDKKLGQTINLPEGCTFNGSAEDPGKLEANTACPPFSATVKLFGFIPINLKLALQEAGPVVGTISPNPANPGETEIKATAKDNIQINGVGLFGLTIPTACETAEPVVFPLESSEPTLELLTKGATASGTTTLPRINCAGGFLGSLFGQVITGLMSGPGNPFTFTIAP